MTEVARAGHSRGMLPTPTLRRALSLAALSSACLRRDVAAEEPTTKISFDHEVPQPAITKIAMQRISVASAP